MLSGYDKKVTPRLPSTSTDVITSKCVVTISNYNWFERTREKGSKSVKCTPHDFDIGFKLSSTAFATERNANEDYHFFYQLMRSETFTGDFLNNVRKYIKRDEKMNVVLEPEDEDVVEDEPPPIEEEEEDDVVPLVRTTTTSASAATVKRLKRL